MPVKCDTRRGLWNRFSASSLRTSSRARMAVDGDDDVELDVLLSRIHPADAIAAEAPTRCR